MGFWSATGDFGNIVGFLLSSLLFHTLSLEWQIPLIIFGVYSLAITFTLYWKVEEVPEKENETAEYGDYLRFVCQVCRQPNKLLHLVLTSSLKAALYLFLLWIPTIIVHAGFQGLEGYIPIGFDVMTVVGSMVLGYMYS